MKTFKYITDNFMKYINKLIHENIERNLPEMMVQPQCVFPAHFCHCVVDKMTSQSYPPEKQQYLLTDWEFTSHSKLRHSRISLILNIVQM